MPGLITCSLKAENFSQLRSESEMLLQKNGQRSAVLLTLKIKNDDQKPRNVDSL